MTPNAEEMGHGPTNSQRDGEAEDGPLPSSVASAGRLIGNKNAKAKRNGASSLASLDAIIEKMV
jgi:hypothetical protein